MNENAEPLESLVDAVLKRVAGDATWEGLLEQTLDPSQPGRAHLAVMHEPYLSLILAGRKTVESRFGKRQIAPYGQVSRGDVLLFKHQSGPVAALAEVRHADFYVLDPPTWELVRERFARSLCANDPTFWEQRRLARYATLMRLGAVRPIEPITVKKRDQRGWVVLHPELRPTPRGQLTVSDGNRPVSLTLQHMPPERQQRVTGKWVESQQLELPFSWFTA